jgi:hypothetical protein
MLLVREIKLKIFSLYTNKRENLEYFLALCFVSWLVTIIVYDFTEITSFYKIKESEWMHMHQSESDQNMENIIYKKILLQKIKLVKKKMDGARDRRPCGQHIGLIDYSDTRA